MSTPSSPGERAELARWLEELFASTIWRAEHRVRASRAASLLRDSAQREEFGGTMETCRKAHAILDSMGVHMEINAGLLQRLEALRDSVGEGMLGEGWRLMESAPFDGTFVLIATESGMVATMQYCRECYWRSNVSGGAGIDPIAWQPSPKPPTPTPSAPPTPTPRLEEEATKALDEAWQKVLYLLREEAFDYPAAVVGAIETAVRAEIRAASSISGGGVEK